MQKDSNKSTAGDVSKTVTAVAHPNIALIKYWGKRSPQLNLPAVGSISLTLDALKTETTVHFDESLHDDRFELNNQEVTGASLKRVSNFLDILFDDSPRPKAAVSSTNNFPSAAGLASSASGFAALALAAGKAAGHDFSQKALSRLARRGSGSAARSIFGGFVEMKRGADPSGDDDYAAPLFGKDYWDIRLIIAITSTEKKSVGSTGGMNRTAETSPFYKSWIDAQPSDLKEMRNALRDQDFEKVGALAEHSCFKMHGLAMSARPPLLYWNAGTVETIQIIQDLRKHGVPAYITIDAGPQVKILCMPEHTDKVTQALETVGGIKQIQICKPGPAAAIKSMQETTA